MAIRPRGGERIMTTRASTPSPESETDLRSWRIEIPGWHPTRLNEMIGFSRFVVARRKKQDRSAIAAWAILTPQALGKRRVGLTIILGPRQRAGDPDAYWKSTLDALVHLGLLKNDNRQWCELLPVAFDRGPAKATTITLEELP
jgi:Holliday junction resolvase RusA-like endonuclease